jgi:hypothetical protein
MWTASTVTNPSAAISAKKLTPRCQLVNREHEKHTKVLLKHSDIALSNANFLSFPLDITPII